MRTILLPVNVYCIIAIFVIIFYDFCKYLFSAQKRISFFRQFSLARIVWRRWRLCSVRVCTCSLIHSLSHSFTHSFFLFLSLSSTHPVLSSSSSIRGSMVSSRVAFYRRHTTSFVYYCRRRSRNSLSPAGGGGHSVFRVRHSHFFTSLQSPTLFSWWPSNLATLLLSVYRLLILR